MKTCPFCAEEIQDAAIVCKHCGRNLPPEPEKPHSFLQSLGRGYVTPRSISLGRALTDLFGRRGTAHQKRSNKLALGCLAAFGVLVLFGLLSSLFTGGGRSTGPSTARTAKSVSNSRPVTGAKRKDGMSEVRWRAWQAMTAAAHFARAKEILKDPALRKENLSAAFEHLETVSVSDPEYVEARRILSGSRLTEAKSALAQYRPNKNPMDIVFGCVTCAREHLEAIRADDPEYVEARRLLSTTVTRIEREIDRLSPILAKLVIGKLQLKKRQEIADGMENLFLDQGMDATVTAGGRGKTVLTIKYALMSRPFVHLFTKKMLEAKVDETGWSNSFQNLKQVGFKHIVFTDGYSSTWSFPVEKLAFDDPRK